MSDQLSKPLLGQYKFLREADRSATCNDIRVQGGAVIDLTPASNNVTIDARLGTFFRATNGAATTFIITNSVDGQIINVILANSSGSAIQPTFNPPSGMTVVGTITTLAGNATGLYTAYRGGATLYVKGDDL